MKNKTKRAGRKQRAEEKIGAYSEIIRLIMIKAFEQGLGLRVAFRMAAIKAARLAKETPQEKFLIQQATTRLIADVMNKVEILRNMTPEQREKTLEEFKKRNNDNSVDIHTTDKEGLPGNRD